MTSKKPSSSVPEDLPRRIVKELSLELATPISKIINRIIKTGEWPAKWKIEYGTQIQKIPNSQTEDNIRLISLTSYFS